MTYSALDAARIAGVTYRMLDHWLSHGMVDIADDVHPGSGGRRRFTQAEVDTLVEVVSRYRAAVSVQEEFRSGQLWAEVRREHDRSRPSASQRRRPSRAVG